MFFIHSFYGKPCQRPVDMQLFESIESGLAGNIGRRRFASAMSTQRCAREHHEKSESRVHLSDAKTVFDIHRFRAWVGIMQYLYNTIIFPAQNNDHNVHYTYYNSASRLVQSVAKLMRSNHTRVDGMINI